MAAETAHSMPVQLSLHTPQSPTPPASRTPSRKAGPGKKQADGPPREMVVIAAVTVCVLLIVLAQFVFGSGLGARPKALPEKPLAEQEAEAAATEQAQRAAAFRPGMFPGLRPPR